MKEYSLLGPAAVRTLVVPIGRWERESFLKKVQLFQERFEARLVDITPLEDATFNPQGFPQGRLMFWFHTSMLNEEQMLFLHDFEPYRKTFVVVGLVNTLDQDPLTSLEALQKRYPDSISHNLVYFGVSVPESKNVYCATSSNVETTVCDIGRNFLEALSLYYSSYKHVTLRSPGAVGGTSVTKTSLMRQPATAPASTVSRVASMDTSSNSGLKRSGSIKSLGLNATSADQQRAKARQCKILGNFQLLAGRYVDSLNNFADAAFTLHKYHDYIWLGSALEGLIISMVLLSQLRVSFQVPAIVSLICQIKDFEQLPHATRSHRNSLSSAPVQSPRNSVSSMSSKIHTVDVQNITLPPLVKALSEKILHYYEVSLLHNTEYAPQVVYCEHVLRILNYMSSHYYPRTPSKRTAQLNGSQSPRNSISLWTQDNSADCFTKWEICQFSNKLFELQLKEMDLVSQIKIYTSLACIYRDIEFHKKQSFVLRILLVSLLPQLESETIFDFWKETQDETLSSLLDAYGIDRQPEALIEDAANCSWVTIQKNILLLCIAMASKIYDKRRICDYSLILLQRYSHVLTQSEQNSLLQNNILPAIDSDSTIGYWDPFLLRNLQIMHLENRREVPQVKLIGVEESRETKQRHSQVFNPFKQSVINSVTDQKRALETAKKFLLGETAELVLTFQNPFKFNLEISHLSFDFEDNKFVQFLKNSTITELPFKVRANSMRSLHLPVKFLKETNGETHLLQRLNVGVFGLKPTSLDIVLAENFKNSGDQTTSRAKFGCFEFQVIAEQPEIEFMSSTLNENTCMILDGTKKSFEIVLRNQSLCRPANYLQFTHITNVEMNLKNDYWKNIPPDDLYDAEYQLKWMQKNCIKIRNVPDVIPPNTSVELSLDLDVTRASFQFSKFEIVLEYGYKPEGTACSIFTKTLRIPFDVTLKRSLEVPSLEVVPLIEHIQGEDGALISTDRIVGKAASGLSEETGSALLLLDIRNSWYDGAKLRVHFEDYSTEEEILASTNTKRFVIPIKRYSFNHNWDHKEIPKLVSGRQFVNSGMAQDEVTIMRRKFWCREAILKSLKCDWKLQDASQTAGSLDFRQFLDKFDTRTVDILYTQRDSPFNVEISTQKSELHMGESLRIYAKIGYNQKHPCSETKPVKLEFLIYNRRTGKLLPKSNTSILYNGQLSKRVTPKYDSEITLDLVPIDNGEYEVGCCLDSVFNDVPVYFRVI
ncbi:LAQU0S14e00584g1_1 [Lachancea quebecensis]|uniref:LAQU0S14e00584g1_1 n=1 Tax=Lachancea quebecensis TaxID=1654605 RepID=A0A0P1KVT6_9SACH|nr:LAQU0S14e00584g1_1 [Lachancea quebecensis]